jgi:threonine synthase
MPSFATHLECSRSGQHYDLSTPQTLSSQGAPLLVRYDLEAVANSLDKKMLARRSEGLWRYREWLPVASSQHRVSLGEVVTPLIPLHGVGQAPALYVKDEARLPTGSFKARGLALAVSMASQYGLKHLAMPTNGNAGAALSAYASRAGMRSTLFCPSDTPRINIEESRLQGAEVVEYDGLIDECGKACATFCAEQGAFNIATLKEPFRIEGKKTMGLELAEQLGWQLPEAIFYPTGGGTGLIGMWKAFDELEAMGWIGSARPKMFAVQADGCAPIVRAFEAGHETAERWEGAHTVAAGIRVPAAIGDFLILRAVRDSGGRAIAVSDQAIIDARQRCASADGLLLCPEGAATLAAWEKAVAEGWIGRDQRAVLFNCASGLKYPLN